MCRRNRSRVYLRGDAKFRNRHRTTVPAHIDPTLVRKLVIEKMAAEAMLNKNRMMVFKNKGKDLEVSESLLYQTDGLAEPLRAIRNYILLAKTRASRRPRVRLLCTI